MYAGNISKGREKSLSYISNAVERLNKEGYAVTFDIYTRSIINVNKLKKGTNYCGAVPYSEICRLQREADIMVHVEGLSIRETLAIRQSFSTKLVDFFKLGKCIFAIGSKKQAFAKHLIDNKAAVVAECEKDVYVKLKELLDNPEKIHSYGKKAYECGKYHHSKEKIQAMLRDDLSKLIKE